MRDFEDLIKGPKEERIPESALNTVASCPGMEKVPRKYKRNRMTFT